jgi:serine phosphatase RsbU (regulator of sigma subunit)
MLLKIKDHHLTVSSAGIPPLFIYRRKTNKIEEYKIKGMPLGALDSFPYETIETELDFGDTVLLMTDGLPELFDKNKQSFGNDKLKEIFIQNANEPVNEIINRLFLAGESWMKDSKQNDDITLVAFRLNEKSKSLQNILSTDSSSR